MSKTLAVTRAADVPTYSMAPAERTLFHVVGDDAVPDVCEETCGEGFGPPLHSHDWDEWLIVSAGRVRVVAGDTETVLAAGDQVFIPAHTPHTFAAHGGEARVIGVTRSGGRFPAMTDKVVPMFQTGAAPDMERIAATAAEYGLTLLGPPLS